MPGDKTQLIGIRKMEHIRLETNMYGSPPQWDGGVRQQFSAGNRETILVTPGGTAQGSEDGCHPKYVHKSLFFRSPVGLLLIRQGGPELGSWLLLGPNDYMALTQGHGFPQAA